MKLLTWIFLFFAFLPLKLEAQVIKAELFEDIKYDDPWFKKNLSETENFERLIGFLKKSKTGVAIIDKASKKAQNSGMILTDILQSGDGSLTDTTLVRRFSPHNPLNVDYETKSKVFLNRHLKTLDAILDLAHELTHYSFREPFNPYNYRFKLKDFIKSTVEGKGGEVDAYLVECKVLLEILPGSLENRSNCHKVFDREKNVLSKLKGIREFYKVGDHISEIKKDMQRFTINEGEIPQITSDNATFISSAWGLPYPVAAVKEYVNIMDRVCRNDKNRFDLIQNKMKRSPASEKSNVDESEFKLLIEDFNSRCQVFLQQS